jgi:hypothetical protein
LSKTRALFRCIGSSDVLPRATIEVPSLAVLIVHASFTLTFIEAGIILSLKQCDVHAESRAPSKDSSDVVITVSSRVMATSDSEYVSQSLSLLLSLDAVLESGINGGGLSSELES